MCIFLFQTLQKNSLDPVKLIFQIDKIDHVSLNFTLHNFNFVELENIVCNTGDNIGVESHWNFASFILFVYVVYYHVFMVKLLLYHDYFELKPDQIGLLDFHYAYRLQNLWARCVVRNYLMSFRENFQFGELVRAVTCKKLIIFVGFISFKRI